MTTIAQLESKSKLVEPQGKGKYLGTTTYYGHEVAQWHSPRAFVRGILDEIDSTIYSGLGIIGPPGRGKSELAKVLAHHTHTLRPEFAIRHGGGNEFRRLKPYIKSLPCQPTVVILDDLTGIGNQMSEREVGETLEALTRSRWLLDPSGKTPIFFIFIYHYSLKFEKSLRAQLTHQVYCQIGEEEKSNLLKMASKGSPRWKSVLQFANVSKTMFKDKKFVLYVGSKGARTYITNKPFRAALVISISENHVILFAGGDTCSLCSEKQIEKEVPPKFVYDKMKSAYGKVGVQALRIILFHMGYYNAIPRDLSAALDFARDQLFSQFVTDYEKLRDLIYHEAKKKPPERIYHKRKQEKELLEEFEEIAEIKEVVPVEKTTSTSTNKEE